MIGHYADRLDKEKPEHKSLVAELRKEATVEGLAFTNLKKRFEGVPRKPANDAEAKQALDSLARLEVAADPGVFDDGLADIVNVLAGLSGGTLPRIEGAVHEKTPEAGAGSYLVGNPAYGQWRQSSSGTSFWEFYGQYALFRDVLWGGPSWTQDRWYRDRGWSFYGDRGRHYYGSRASQNQWSTVERRNPQVPKKTFRSTASERRVSTYGKTADRKAGTVTRRANAHSGYGASVRGTTIRRTSSWGGRSGK